MNDGRRLRNAGLVLFSIAMLSAYALVSSLDLDSEIADLAQCQEMMELWERTQGEFGWPQGTCDAI
jgi:hypothetical protein